MKKNVLIVDDNPEIIELLESFFAYNQYDVTKATNGSDALSSLKQGPFSIILTDINLPDLDGFAIISKIRSNSMYEETPIIGISGISDISLEKKIMMAGANVFLRKPFSIQQLNELLDSLGRENEKNDISENITARYHFLSERYQNLINDFENYMETSDNILKARNLDELAYILLTYISVELGLNQVVLWLVDQTNETLKPIKAIGPLTREDYHRNLLSINNISINELIKNYKSNQDSALNEVIQHLTIPLNEDHIFQEIISQKASQPQIIDYPLKKTYYNNLLLEKLRTDRFIIIPLADQENNIKVFVYGNTIFSGNTIAVDNLPRVKTILKIGDMVLNLTLLYEKVKYSESKYKNLIDNAEDIIALLDEDLNIISINPAVFSILGYTPEQIIGTPIYQYFSLKLDPEIIRYDLENKRSGEIKMVHRNGATLTLEYRTRVFTNEEDQIQIEVIARDTTEKNRLEKELKQNVIKTQRHNFSLNRLLNVDSNISLEMETQQILNAVCQSIAQAKLFGRALLSIFDENWQPKYLGFAGITEKEIIRLKENGFLTREERLELMTDRFRISNSYFIPAESQMLKTIKKKTIESTKKARQFINWDPKDILFVPLKVEDRVIGILSVDDPYDGLRPTLDSIQVLELFAYKVSNFYSRSRLYKKLLHTQQYLSNLIKNSTDIIITADLDENIVIYNNGAENILNYNKDEIKNLKFRKLFQNPEDCDFLFELLYKNPEGKVKNYETTLISKAGSDIPIEFSSIVLYDIHQNPIGIEIIGKDMTEHLKLENIKIKNERLNTISKLAVSVSHEINNPLQVIMNKTRDLFDETHNWINKSENDKFKSELTPHLKNIKSIWNQIFRVKSITDKFREINESHEIKDINYADSIDMIEIKPSGKSNIFNGYRFLLADDEEEILNDIKNNLQDLGASITAVPDGEQAFKELMKNKFDLVISDIKMPKLNGYELFRNIRREGIKTPVLFMTAFGYDPDHSAVKACVKGCPMPLFKPVDRSLLEKRIKEILFNNNEEG